MGPQAIHASGVVAVGASAGGIEALTELAAGMPADFPLAVMMVIHTSPESPSLLAQIIDRNGPLPATTAVEGSVIEAGRIYAAVPDHHLLVRDHRVALSEALAKSGLRPSIDELFCSVASDYGPQAVGVLLSGLLHDGVAGLRAIKAAGGMTVVQDPADAVFPDLPQHAVAAGVADYAVAAQDIGGLIARLLERDPQAQTPAPEGGWGQRPA